MRHVTPIAVAVILAAACSDSGVAPTSPDGIPPTIRASLTGTDPGPDELCDGLSPCDGYEGYSHTKFEKGINIKKTREQRYRTKVGFVVGIEKQFHIN